MMKNIRQKPHMLVRLTLVVTVAVGVVFGTQFAIAQEQNSNVSNSSVTNTRGAGRLEAAKLKACQNHQGAINRIMSRMVTRAKRQLTVFTTITNRVETFYTTKGRTISTYDALVSDVNAKKTAAETQIATLESSATFDCTADNPKGLATTFKDQLRATITLLQSYKIGIKNLIVGVKSAQGQESSANSNVTTPNTQGQ